MEKPAVRHHIGSLTDEASHSVADHRQSLRAACPRRWPRVAVALSGQATTRLSAALTPPAPPAPARASFFSHFASSLLAVASAVLVLPRRRHFRRSAEVACARHRCIHQLVALSASPQPSPSFPPCLARDCTLGELLLALRRRRSTLAGVPPWPLPWPYFVGAPQAS